MSTEAADKITKCKFRMVNKQPFFAVIALSLPFVEAPWLNPPTMATDMQNIYYHPKFVEDHSMGEIEAVIAHEVLHVANLHGTRRGTRNHLLWNIACDYAINLIVKDAGYKLPDSALMDEKYRDWSATAIYEDLLKNAPKIKVKMPSTGDGEKGEGDEDGIVLDGAVFDPGSIQQDGSEGHGMTDAQRSELEQELKIKVKQAAESAKARGNLPAGLEGLIEAVGKPKINWKEYIQSWVSGVTPDDYTWSKPNRTMLANHRVFMPTMTFNGAGVGVLSIDTSGSVSDGELVQYITEIVGVIEICKPEKLYILQHDAILQKVDIWEAGMDFANLKVKGRGGTCIQPIFRHLEKIDEQIDWMICFTDMGIGDYPTKEQAPDFPVLWAATGPMNAPFGSYIPLRDAMDI